VWLDIKIVRYTILYPKRSGWNLISKTKALELYDQVAKDESDVKEAINRLRIHPRCVLSIETLDMIWDGLLMAANDFHREVLADPLSDAMVPKAELVRYYKKVFFNNVVFREVYCNCSYLPDLSEYSH
jgi:hypothetical protein